MPRSPGPLRALAKQSRGASRKIRSPRKAGCEKNSRQRRNAGNWLLHWPRTAKKAQKHDFKSFKSRTTTKRKNIFTVLRPERTRAREDGSDRIAFCKRAEWNFGCVPSGTSLRYWKLPETEPQGEERILIPARNFREFYSVLNKHFFHGILQWILSKCMFFQRFFLENFCEKFFSRNCLANILGMCVFSKVFSWEFLRKNSWIGCDMKI